MASCHAKFFAEGGAEAAATGGWAIPVIVLGSLATLFCFVESNKIRRPVPLLSQHAPTDTTTQAPLLSQRAPTDTVTQVHLLRRHVPADTPTQVPLLPLYAPANILTHGSNLLTNSAASNPKTFLKASSF